MTRVCAWCRKVEGGEGPEVTHGICPDCERKVLAEVVSTHDQAPGALPNGALVEKLNTEPGDTHRDGARAVVVGSLGPYDGLPDPYGYFVEWDDIPGVPVAIGGHRIRVVQHDAE